MKCFFCEYELNKSKPHYIIGMFPLHAIDRIHYILCPECYKLELKDFIGVHEHHCCFCFEKIENEDICGYIVSRNLSVFDKTSGAVEEEFCKNCIKELIETCNQLI